MEFNFGTSYQALRDRNREPSENSAVFDVKPWAAFTIVGVVIALAAGAIFFFSSNSGPANSGLVSSGVTEDLNIERVEGIQTNHKKKFKNKTAQFDYGVLVWTSDYSGACEPVIQKATWDRVGKFVTLTKTPGTGCLLTKRPFQQRITPIDGSKFPAGTRITYVEAAKP